MKAELRKLKQIYKNITEQKGKEIIDVHCFRSY